MLSLIAPYWLTGTVTLLLLIATITFWFVVMLPFVALRCVPVHRVQRLASRICVGIARCWVASDAFILRTLHRVRWQIEFEGDALARLDPRRSYLLIANHQSWADILVLFDVFHRKTPFARFFMKRDLLWVPIVGQVCWAMDMPFMTRKAGSADLVTTRRTCALYREVPVTVVNFVEGTRFTPAKHALSRSPYQQLLRPKAGGIAYTLGAMGDQFAGILDVTLIYQPSPRPLAWSWLCGEQGAVKVHVKWREVPQELLAGDYQQDPAHRARVQAWLDGLWREKDARLGTVAAPEGLPEQAG